VSDPIQCRARLEPDCAHNDEDATRRRRESVGDDWREDGTYQRSTGTIVCDSCYSWLLPIIVALPTQRGRELVDLAIDVYRRRGASV
jgi:hypothetical protein